MSSKKMAVFGIYPQQAAADVAVDAFIAAGFYSSAISGLLPDTQSSQAFAHHKDTKAPEGTAVGVTAGGAIGGVLGLLAGIGVLAIPGVGPLIAAGPIMAGLAGLGVGGAVGGIVGALTGMGIPEYEAKRYEGQRLGRWHLLAPVHCDTNDEVSRAKSILKGTRAEDIASSSELKLPQRQPRPPEGTLPHEALHGRLALFAVLGAVPARNSSGPGARNNSRSKCRHRKLHGPRQYRRRSVEPPAGPEADADHPARKRRHGGQDPVD